jgi:hypothetical protein
MIELYVLASLLGLGYYLHTSAEVNHSLLGSTAGQIVPPAPRDDRPSASTPYASQRTREVADDERRRADKRVASMRHGGARRDGPMVMRDRSVYSTLLGRPLSAHEFQHNNMVPFYGAAVKQNTRVEATQPILEKFAGSSSRREAYPSKREVDSMFTPQRDVGNVFGGAAVSDTLASRVETPRVRNNYFPVPQMRVGPGLDAGFQSRPSGGFHQASDVRPKTVDELRVVSNPKQSYVAPVIPGTGPLQRTTAPASVPQQRVGRVFEQGVGRHFVGPADVVAARVRSSFQASVSEERVLQEDYMGVAAQPGKQRYSGAGADASLCPKRAEAPLCVPVTNLTAPQPDPLRDDYGRSAVPPRPNHTRRGTQEDYSVGNARVLLPQQQATAGLGSPADVLPPRLSRKELTVHFADDPRNMRAQMPQKASMYDPNQVTRTTLKETTIHDEWTGVMGLAASRTSARQPDETTRPTVRETTPQATNDTNLRRVALFGQVHDPDCVQRTTTKETTVDRTWTGQVSSLQKADAYQVTEVNLDPTLRQLVSDTPSFGSGPTREQGTGYLVAPSEVRATQKQALSDTEHYGTAGTVSAKAAMSYQDIYNATLNELRQDTLRRPAPVPQSTKVAAGCDNLNVEIKVQELLPSSTGLEKQRVTVGTQPSVAPQLTRCPPTLSQAARLNPVTMRPTDPGSVRMAPPHCPTDCLVGVIKEELQNGTLTRFF